MAVGLEETMDEEVINQGPQFIEYMVNELDRKGIPGQPAKPGRVRRAQWYRNASCRRQASPADPRKAPGNPTAIDRLA